VNRVLAMLLAVSALFLLAGESAPARPAFARVLFLYGSVPPGTDPNDMVRIGNTGRNGYAQLAEMLETQGYAVTEMADTAPAVNPLNASMLAGYNLLVLGSNNRRFGEGEVVTALAYVEAGGALLAFSDSRFGLSPDRGSNALGAGELSDNDILSKFSMTIQHDNYQEVVADSNRFSDPAHRILRGLSSFKGEGVSLIRVNGLPAKVLVRGDGLLLTDGHTITGPNYAITAVALAGRGRVAATFDRNTFFNAGVGSDGTDLGELDNRAYALNLFRWLVEQK